ncbi:hypothetical protein LEM8419_01701 [Neolewinella maritima]|uniref:GLPGLI family protein n=2 Tax=Neolewinella maritima TaxID=1383882 RepID=A0ABM9B0F0_9BACT|nr:hypothetical protein LEM8419_01701 [Neolewinella maritima]
MNDGSTYTYYLPHEFYTWSITYPSKVVAERKILEDQTPIYFKGQPNPEWEITTETKIIDGYTVQKAICTNSYVPATGDYHLQDAIAWFTMDIPVSVGPERYYGLPGLIVLLEHSGRKTVRTKLKAISFDDIDTVDAVEVPAAAIVVSLEEIVRPYGIDRKWLRDEKKRWKEVSSR